MPRTYPQAQCGGLTSPIAYLSSLPNDPFKHDINGVAVTAPVYYERAGFGFSPVFPSPQPVNLQVFVPQDAVGTSKLDGIGADTPVATEDQTPARYVLYSLGPDLVFNLPGGIASRFNLSNRYDPTNGTVSPGNVVRFPGGSNYP
jgi:hypothetical protein